MRIALLIICALASLVVILAVMFQTSNSSGLSGALTGGADQLFKTKKSKGYDKMLSNATIIGIAVLVVCVVVLGVIG